MNFGWVFGVFLGILSIIAHFTYIPLASEYNYWLLIIAFIMVCVSAPRH